jgi:hypothetical protein
MRKATIVLGVILAFLGLGLVATPAQADDSSREVSSTATAWDWGTQAAPDSTDSAGNGYAMGVRPNWWTLCIANGYGPTVVGPAASWNYPGRALTISVRNVCTGYSVTNRMTIDNINNSGACIQYTRLNNTAPTQLAHLYAAWYIWNNNPVIWINTRSGCNGAGGQLEHNAGKGVGYILGLAYDDCSTCLMGPDSNNVTRASNGDSLDANVIYQN